MGQLAYFARSPMGIFLFSASGDLLFYRLFSRRAVDAFQEYSAASQKDIPDQKKYQIIEDRKSYELLRKNFRDYAKSLGFAENDRDLNAFLSQFCAIMSKKSVSGRVGRDRLLIQSINALDDLNKTISLLETRIYEWYTLHYPELRNTKDFVDNIATYGTRENYPNFKNSLGIDLNEKDQEMLVEFAITIQHLNEEKTRLENYVRSFMKEIAPNTSSLIDELLGARLIALAGSLEKLARMPASTIQLLGAEKALFRHLNKKGKSPKYGVLYTCSLIQTASNDSKGKVARILSSKIMLAARIDFYSGRFEQKLKQEMDSEIKQIG